MADQPPGLAAMMADSALPDHAARVGFHVATHDHGDGVELRLEDVSRLLHGIPGDDKCRTALRILTTTGYVSRTPGGRGHGDLFRWLGADRVGFQPQPKNSLGSEPHPNGEDRVGLQPQAKLAWGSSPTLNQDSMGVQPQAKSPLHHHPCTTSSSDARTRAVGQDAERAMADRSDLLDGCRGPMRDYLTERVDPDRQAAYVWRVVTALEGGDEWMWTDRTGKRLHRDDRTPVLAAAFNELLAGAEVGKHFPEPPGGFANLRSKVRYLVASRLGVERDALRPAGTDGPHPRRRTPDIDISNQGSLD